MPDPEDSEQQLKKLQETIRVLSLENESLAERAEDTTLLGLIAEKISHCEDAGAVIDTALEQISLLKDIPLCACCRVVDGQLRVGSSFVSFAEAAVTSISLVLPGDFRSSGTVLLAGSALHAARAAIVLPAGRYEPAALLLIPFESADCTCSVFVFADAADSGRLDSCQVMLLRVVELLTTRIGILHLLGELREAKEHLDRKVERRTSELSEAYRELEQEMAERVTAQEALQESERLLNETQAVAGLGTYVLDVIAGIWESSNVLDSIFGIDKKFVRSLEGWVLLIHPDDRAMMFEYFTQEVVGKCCSFDREYRIMRQNDGGVRWVHGLGKLDIDEQNKPVRMVGTIQDITVRKQAEQALRESEEKYRRLFEDSRDMIFISAYDGRFIDINSAGVKLLGYHSKEALMSVAIRDTYAHPADRERFLSLLGEHDYVADFATKLLRQDGQQIEVAISATAVRDDQGKVVAIRGIIRDITEHQRLEDQLRQSQKMESIGTLAGGVAHDFNNILTAVIGYGHLALMKMSKDDPNRLNIEQMLEASDRAAHLTKDLLLFSRKQIIDRKPVDLNEIIRKTGKFLMRVIGEDITFKTILPEEEIPILADAHQLEQVLMNLATNARDAMPKGGTLTVATGQIRFDEHFITLHGYGKPGVYAMISVSDTGEGMDEQTSQKIFEPFFTTKEVGKGTGLGLAVVYGIIRQHDGYINVYSERGIGTTFRICLPVTACGLSGKMTKAPEEEPAGGRETILLAEDNEIVRNLTETVLKDFGYEVITAVDGEDAVRKYLEHNEDIDLLLFDLIMPGKSGKEAYDEIRKMRPDIKILFASGYSPDIIRDKAALRNGATIVYKPISPLELLKSVRSVLAGD
ncbi:MAG: hypothetical protein C0402_12670 [Thermodesulfovibrio sp.]|nr:hypothetical protein [Thermodesulfovibrio sp.]